MSSLKRFFGEEVSPVTLGRGLWVDGCNIEVVSVSLPELAHTEATWTLVGLLSVMVR